MQVREFLRNFMHKIGFILLATCFSFFGKAQELNCNVQVVGEAVSNVDKAVFEAMQTSIFEFMNNRKWTTEVYASEERIECSILINITSAPSTSDFKGTMSIQSRRPVFKTSYNTPVINHQDNDIRFQYVQFQSLEYSEATYISELTSLLAFYAYMIIGMDGDSFEEYGGEKYLQRAQQIVNNAQSSKIKGWKAYEGTANRYWMIENYLNNPQFKPLRVCMYKYHRLGMDVMTENLEEGRAKITEGLQGLKAVHRVKPNSFNVKFFFNAKNVEIVNIYSQAFPDQKAKIINLLNQVDPGNTSKYEQIRATN